MSAARPDLVPVLTYTSSSMTRWPNPLPVAHTDYAPPETHGEVAHVFAAVDPALLVVSRSDLWPELLIGARARGVPVAVSGGLIRPASRRLAWPARTVLSDLYRSIRWVGAVTEDDARRWRLLGLPAEAVTVTGDPRHDQVLERITEPGRLQVPPGQGPVVVAGSVEKEDLPPLFVAFDVVRRARPDARLIVVPHDSGLLADGRLRDGVTVMTTPGILADLYAFATLAYVGGGLGARGQHSTLEPAAFAVPVLVPTTDGNTLAQQWLDWLGDAVTAGCVGLGARAGLATGASRATTKALLRLLA